MSEAIPPTEKWYRMESRSRASIDEWGDVGHVSYHVELIEFSVAGRTPKCVWLTDGGYKRLVRLGARRRFACPTITEARESFIARKEKQAEIYRAKLKRAEGDIRMASSKWGGET